MDALLEKYRKQPGTGPNSTINLADWNGLIDELSSTLAGLIKKGADFDAIATVAISVLLDRVNNVLGPAYDQVAARGAQVEAMYAALAGGGIGADSVVESTTRSFLTDARRAAILTELRGGVAADGNTLGKLYAYIDTLNTGLQSLNSATAASLANRVRFDAAQSLSAAQRIQAKQNIGAAGTGIAVITAATPLDSGYVGKLIYTYNAGYAVTLPLLSTMKDGDFFDVLNIGAVTFVRHATDATANAPLYLEGGLVASVASYPGEILRIWYYAAGGGWMVQRAIGANAALLADRVQAFSAAQKTQLLANLAPSGLPLQRVGVMSAALASTTTQTPVNDAAPTTSNSALITALLASIAPKAAGNTIRVRAVVNVSLHGLGAIVAALFQNGGATAVAANIISCPGADYSEQITVEYSTTAPSTSPMTFQVGVSGNNGYTTTINGINLARLLGGVAFSMVEIMEFAA